MPLKFDPSDALVSERNENKDNTMSVDALGLCIAKVLTQCGPVTSFGDKDLGQHWLG